MCREECKRKNYYADFSTRWLADRVGYKTRPRIAPDSRHIRRADAWSPYSREISRDPRNCAAVAASQERPVAKILRAKCSPLGSGEGKNARLALGSGSRIIKTQQR